MSNMPPLFSTVACYCSVSRSYSLFAAYLLLWCLLAATDCELLLEEELDDSGIMFLKSLISWFRMKTPGLLR